MAKTTGAKEVSGAELVQLLKGEIINANSPEAYQLPIEKEDGISYLMVENLTVINAVHIKEDDVFPQAIKIGKNTLFKEDFKIEDGTFEEQFKIDGGSFNGWFEVKSGEEKEKAKFQSIIITNKVPFFKGGFHFAGVAESIEICNERVEDMYLSGTIGQLRFHDFWTRNRIRIEDAEIRKLAFHNFANKSDLLLSGGEVITTASKSSKLLFTNSNMGAAEFKNFPFGDYQEIHITGTVLNEIIMIGGENKNYFPTQKKFIKENLPQDLVNTFSDLAHAMGKQGNVDKKLDYHAAFQRSNRSWKFQKWPGSLSIFFNRITNNYNRSWLLGVGTFVLFSFVACFFILWTTDDFTFAQTVSYIFTAKFWDNWIQFINPTQRLFTGKGAFDDFHPTFWTRILEIVSYFVMVAWLYQIVQAFREYGRK